VCLLNSVVILPDLLSVRRTIVPADYDDVTAKPGCRGLSKRHLVSAKKPIRFYRHCLSATAMIFRVPADYDGDSKGGKPGGLSRPLNGTWYLLNLTRL